MIYCTYLAGNIFFLPTRTTDPASSLFAANLQVLIKTNYSSDVTCATFFETKVVESEVVFPHALRNLGVFLTFSRVGNAIFIAKVQEMSFFFSQSDVLAFGIW